MSTLNWREATTLHLNTELIPNPNAAHDLLKQLRNVRVAIEGSFLHIDPRQKEDRASGSGEYDAHIVPASAVKSIVYRDKASSAGAPWVAHG